MSVGIRGFRVGSGPRGHYVHAGRGGLYYRSSLGRAGERRAAQSISPLPHSVIPPAEWITDGVEMLEVESGDVLEMRDSSVIDLLDDINGKSVRYSVGKIVLLAGFIFGVLAGFIDARAALAIWLITVPAWLFGRWIDGYKRKAVLFYDLEEDARDAYERLTSTFDALAGCAGVWHVESGGRVNNLTTWKRNAGASHIVSKKPTTLAYALPKFVASNITPPSAQVGLQTLYFFPDILMIVHGSKAGAVGYADLGMRWQESNFIEEGRVPPDAVVIGQTWKHPNKTGGPDRRFRDNHQIPICRYEVLHLQSDSGLNELLEFSKSGVVSSFAAAAKALSRVSAKGPPAIKARF